MLGEESLDWDIVTPGNAHTLARQLADTLGGHYVHMHEKASRVVVLVEDADSPATKREMHLDISPLIGKTIEDDLHHRDFTINAIAAPLDQVVQYLASDVTMHVTRNVGATLAVARGTGAGELGTGALAQETGTGSLGTLNLIDPLNGLADLQARRLKAVDDHIFRHDPLRMLRAVRLMMRYQLQIEPWTASLISRDAGLLPEVAPERVHDELYAILGPDGAASRLHFLDEHDLFMIIFPEFAPARGMRQPYPHHWDVLTHSIETVAALEQIAQLVQGHPVGGGDAAATDTNTMRAPFTYGGDATATDTNTVGAPFMGARRGGAAATDLDLADIRILLHEAEQQGIFSLASLTAPRMKLAALLHDIGKPLTYSCDQEGAIHFYNHPLAGVPLVEQIMRRLCASTQDRRLAQLVAAHHMRPGQLGHDGPVTPRATRRYFVDLGPTGISIALFSLADHLATLGPQPTADSWQRHLAVVRLLLTRYIRERDSILPPRLISPEELMRRLNLEPGPIVGQLLDLIAEAQAEGKVHSKEEAVWFAEEHLDL